MNSSPWLLTKNGLPTKGGSYLVMAETNNCFGDLQYIVAVFDELAGYFRLVRFDDKPGKKVTTKAWMPIPKHPKEVWE